MKALRSIATTFARGQGESRGEKLNVVSFVGCPDPNAVVEVFSEVNQYPSEFPKRIVVETERVVDKTRLGVRERLSKLLDDLGKMRIALPSVSVWAICGISYGMTFLPASVVLPCHVVWPSSPRLGFRAFFRFFIAISNCLLLS